MLRRLVLPSPQNNLKNFKFLFNLKHAHAFLLKASFCLVDYILQYIKKEEENK